MFYQNPEGSLEYDGQCSSKPFVNEYVGLKGFGGRGAVLP